MNIIVSFFCVKSTVPGGRKMNTCRIMPCRSFNLKLFEATCEFAQDPSSLLSLCLLKGTIGSGIVTPTTQATRFVFRERWSMWPPENTRLCEKLHRDKSSLLHYLSFHTDSSHTALKILRSMPSDRAKNCM